jgi:hypothetical protein
MIVYGASRLRDLERLRHVVYRDMDDPHRVVRVGCTRLVKYTQREKLLSALPERIRADLAIGVSMLEELHGTADFLAVVAVDIDPHMTDDERVTRVSGELNLALNVVAFVGGPLVGMEPDLIIRVDGEPSFNLILAATSARPHVHEAAAVTLGDEREYYDQPDFLEGTELKPEQVEQLRHELQSERGPSLPTRLNALAPIVDPVRAGEEVIRALRKAVDWAFEARAQQRDAMAFLCYWFAIESLVRGPNPREGQNVKLLRRLRSVLEPTPTEYAFLSEEFLEQLYHARNRMVHNGMMIPGRDDETQTYGPFSLAGTHYLESVIFILRRVFSHVLSSALRGEASIAGAWTPTA